jgi:PAS domain S-box-containing protein
VIERIQQLLEGAVDAAVVLDEDRRILHYNRAYEAASGLRGRALARRVAEGARCHEVFALDVCAAACVGCAARQAGRPRRVDEVSALHGDGEPRTFIVTATPLRDDDGRAVVVETYRDVTADVRIQRRLKTLLDRERQAKHDLEAQVRARTAELHQAQATVLHQEKMSSLGRLVAGIAHELNNPINFIYGNVDFLGQYMEDLLGLVADVDRLPLSDEARQQLADAKRRIDLEFLVEDWRKLLRSIRAGAERTASIVGDLKTYSRSTGGEARETDLVAGIEMTLHLVAPLLQGRITVRRDIPPEVPRVLGNAGHLNQVFMNLLANAAQAIVGEGSIDLRVEVLDGGDRLRVTIADSGSGIPVDAMAKLTEPFFTTKEVGHGTGLGLWISDTIVRAHGGSMRWHNDDGGGAVFVVELPVRPPAAGGGRDG